MYTALAIYANKRIFGLQSKQPGKQMTYSYHAQAQQERRDRTHKQMIALYSILSITVFFVVAIATL